MRKPSLQRHAADIETELNITPVMNLFVILIPFLLLSAVFVQVAVIPNSIPNLQTVPTKQMKKQKEKSLELKIVMNDEGYTIIGRGGILDLGASKKKGGATIPKVNGEFDTQTLNRVLFRIRKAHPSLPIDEPVILYPKGNVKYEEIVATMDAAREAWDENGQVMFQDAVDEKGRKVKKPISLFPNVIIGAELVE